jgi:transcription-repair coupling factor (superfamily II helicase)
VPRPPGSSDALWIARLARHARPLVVVTAVAADAQRLVEEVGFFDPALAVSHFPDWETLPYDQFSPHQDLVSERLATLYRLVQGDIDCVLVSAPTALARLVPRDFLAGRTFFLRRSEKLDADRLRDQLVLAGYHHVTQVLAPGEYCIRGSLIDLFPTGSVVPYRVDLDDDRIDSIRTFDVDTQRSIYKVETVRMLPAREFPTDEEGRARFRRAFRDRFEGDPARSSVYRSVSKGTFPPGIEYYLPLFFEETATLVDYLPANALVCLHGDVLESATAFWRDTGSRHGLLRGDGDRPLLEPRELYLTSDDLFAAIRRFPRLHLTSAAAAATDVPSPDRMPTGVDAAATAPFALPLPAVQVERRANDPLGKLKAFAAAFDGRVLLLADSLGRRETIGAFCREYGIAPAIVDGFPAFLAGTAPVTLAVGPLGAGFVLDGEAIAVVTENELYATQARTQRVRDAARRANPEQMLRDLAEVRLGDPVVHESHGIGRYLGLQTMDLGEGATEFLTLEYAGGTKLYVPVAQLHAISRYSGAQSEQVALSQLGTPQWDRAKRRAAQQVRDTAAELLQLYAQRAARQGDPFTPNAHDVEAFAEAFPFEETPDQAAAIQAVMTDLHSGRPMDRLVCGDVGFGKTEVAMRAAFIAASTGHQVAVLVPTTLLAEQHFNNFSDRFADWPVRIAELSRFRSGKEQAQAIEAVADGRVDIVIGTHKLLGSSVRFKRLGLVIIDEEHRFGVRQKERLKQLRAEVHVLTLTATPIPRTLAMALEGLREFSVIATAPQRRLAIRTFVAPYSGGLVREAVLRELKRGGQVYVLHNDIDTIESTARRIAELVPEAQIRIAHGQMRERELELVMRDFYQQRFNVLLCTTIIETGIDVPSANTILIDRADRFGLAQLHQLRGRVGRSHHQAYAYLLIPDDDAVTTNARKRLEAIQSMEELGSGFYLAMHDLEIRGAGQVLGESQSGEMQAIGFSLYSSMLEHAVRSLRAGKEPDLEAPLGMTTEINLHAPALLPDAFCSDVHERLVLYKRLAHCDSEEGLERLQEEMIDRFGLPPEPVRTLVDTHRLRLLGQPLGVTRIDADGEKILLQFGPGAPVDPVRIIELVQQGRQYAFAGPDRIRISAKTPDAQSRALRVREVFRELLSPTAPVRAAARRK